MHTYNHARPHQSLDMVTPASLFRSSAPKPLIVPPVSVLELEANLDSVPVAEDAPPLTGTLAAVEWEVRVPPCGYFSIAAVRLWLGPAYSDRIVSVWADDRSIQVAPDGHHFKTVSSRLQDEHPRCLLLRGARPAGPPPSTAALPRAGRGRFRLPETTAVEVDRSVVRDGVITFNTEIFSVDPGLVGQRITLCLDGHLMHAIAANMLVKPWPPPRLDRLPRDQSRRARQATAKRIAPDQRHLMTFAVCVIITNACWPGAALSLPCGHGATPCGRVRQS